MEKLLLKTGRVVAQLPLPSTCLPVMHLADALVYKFSQYINLSTLSSCRLFVTLSIFCNLAALRENGCSSQLRSCHYSPGGSNLKWRRGLLWLTACVIDVQELNADRCALYTVSKNLDPCENWIRLLEQKLLMNVVNLWSCVVLIVGVGPVLLRHNIVPGRCSNRVID